MRLETTRDIMYHDNAASLQFWCLVAWRGRQGAVEGHLVCTAHSFDDLFSWVISRCLHRKEMKHTGKNPRLVSVAAAEREHLLAAEQSAN